MPHRKRVQARDVKYHVYEEFGRSAKPRPFLKPALDRTLADLSPEERAFLRKPLDRPDTAGRQEP